MVETGKADALISGLTRNYPSTIKPALHVIGKDESNKIIAGMYIMLTKKGPLFFADATVNKNPTAEELIEIAVLVAKAVQSYKVKPHIAMLSYSNFGSSDGEEAVKVSKAVQILQNNYPGMVVDGEIQANFAFNQELISEFFPFSALAGKEPNTFIFPNLSAANITYKMLQEMDAAEAIGPILLGMKKPVHILQLGSSVREIVNMVTIAVNDVQGRK
jgi:malate dehydrogenase (oxaloacetate-decarboxylating)(NADP+)